MSIIELNDVRYSYKNKYRTVDAINGISCGFDSGKVYALMGRSGSGKTTLLSLIAGLDLPTSGQIVCDGAPTSETDLLTVSENVMYPMELRGMKPAEAKERAAELVESVGLPADVLDRFPAMLSGGEQQRVAIARALGMETKVLLADEPTGNLDEDNSAKIFELLRSLAHDRGYCVVIVTHDEAIGRKADVTIRIRDGVIAE